MERPCVYILANRPNGTLYVGMTQDLPRRMEQHKSGRVPGFTKRYGVDILVYVERHDTAAAAMEREQRLKRWRRAWKIDLIESVNATWRDLTLEPL